jgi:hypothetical protein
MLAEMGHELWIGDAAEIRDRMVRKQKTDARDAAHLLVWRPTMAESELPSFCDDAVPDSKAKLFLAAGP